MEVADGFFENRNSNIVTSKRRVVSMR